MCHSLTFSRAFYEHIHVWIAEYSELPTHKIGGRVSLVKRIVGFEPHFPTILLNPLFPPRLLPTTSRKRRLPTCYPNHRHHLLCPTQKKPGYLVSGNPALHSRGPVAFCPHLTVGLAFSEHDTDMTHDFAREACHL